MGSTSDTCDWSAYSAASVSLNFQCPQDFYLKDLSHYGFLYIRDQIVNRMATGEATCNSVKNPQSKILDFYQEKEEAGAYQTTEA